MSPTFSWPSTEQMYPNAPWCCTAAPGYYPQQVPGYYPGYCPQQVLFTLAWVLDQCIHALFTAGTHPLSKDTRQMFFFFAHFFAQLVSILSQKTLVKCSCFLHIWYEPSLKSQMFFFFAPPSIPTLPWLIKRMWNCLSKVISQLFAMV